MIYKVANLSISYYDATAPFGIESIEKNSLINLIQKTSVIYKLQPRKWEVNGNLKSQNVRLKKRIWVLVDL